MVITERILQLRILPRWIIILIDLSLVAFATILGYLLRFNFVLLELIQRDFYFGIIINCLALLLAIAITRSHAGIVRYTGLKDGVRLFNTLILSMLFVGCFNLIYYYNVEKNLIPYSVVLISFLASFLFLFQYRLLIKNIFSYYKTGAISKTGVVIFGAGQLGMITKQVIESDHRSNLKVVGFLEDDLRKVGKVIDGTTILSAEDIEFQMDQLGVGELIIAVQGISVERKNEVVDVCLKNGVKVRNVPNVNDWVQGELSLKQIKEVRIEDLLGRESIKLDNEAINRELLGKRVFITGAAGSIGSELVRQVAKYKPAKITLIDQAESPLYELERELEDVWSSTRIYVADITDCERIERIFESEKPEVVFHAAAYKHVPLMEANVEEAVKTNVFGTKTLADLSVKYCVERFVMISTDKAVNPTSVMGCSKRIAEIYVQSLNNHVHDGGEGTVFVTTRFGNVLGSNGSVIPFFKKQINNGGPVTVTHPDITRYFMTITEACQLVLEAGAMGNGGEIFIFDMGRSVKIVDLAKKMIRLSGLELDKDIEIVFTGLRQGEKLYEELLSNSENTIPTHHHKIMIATVKEYGYQDVKAKFSDLSYNLENSSENQFGLVKTMKEIVPEYISNNSHYDAIDKEMMSLK
ncbi:MAG: nucleoside-diphosphate sugar epimerase/dehydratase [Bacteroidota bacterium]